MRHAALQRVRLIALLILCALAGAIAPASAQQGAVDPPGSFRVLCYHDVREDLRASFATEPDATAVDVGELTRQFSWLRENGFRPVSIEAIERARAGGPPLPPKAVLLTFDDGYRSVYTRVYPLLKLFRYPAVIALVGDWLDSENTVRYGDTLLPRERFVNWGEVREMQDSGLVEVALHSHDLHRGIVANPQGNLIPAAIARNHDAASGRYESDAEYEARVGADLERGADLLWRMTGWRPRVMVWPYGAYNEVGLAAARVAGMPITMNLEPGPNPPAQPLDRIRRSLVNFNHTERDLIETLRAGAVNDGQVRPIERVVHVDLDYVYDPDPARQERNLSLLLERILYLKPGTVYLQAFADPDGDGVADALYFPNRHLPMRADLFSRVAWQLRTRTGVRVYAWMPALSFLLPAGHPAAARVVEVDAAAPAAARARRQHRLSPFDPLVRHTVTEIFADLAKHSVFGGILFHDDVTLSDWEDASPAALREYAQWGLGGLAGRPATLRGGPAALRGDPISRRAFAERKTAFLTAFTLELLAEVRRHHPAVLSARNLFALPVKEDDAHEWFAQSLASFLPAYDYTAIMAMPYMENAADPQAWLDALVDRVKRTPGALDRVVFELQSVDWRDGTRIPAAVLAGQMRRLHLKGARHFGYYPDDFHNDHPAGALVRPAFSLEAHPVKR